jgi:GNAT superfamily N-acetyltransferase
VRIERLVTEFRPAGTVDDLARLLVDAVDGGASVGFLAPLAESAAREFWRESLTHDDVLTWVAREDGGTIAGVVQLALPALPNAAHRGEVKKLLVHRAARGRGIASELMAALEAEAAQRGRWVLMLDTQTGSPAELIYARWGWRTIGVMDQHAADPSGRLAPTTFMTKQLTRPADSP